MRPIRGYADKVVDPATGTQPGRRKKQQFERPVALAVHETTAEPRPQTPFARRDRALAVLVSGEAAVAPSALGGADPFGDLLALRRPPRPAQPVVLDRAIRDVRRRERIYRRALAASDALAVALAVLVSMDVLGGYRVRPLYLLVVPLTVLAAKIGGLYDKDELVIDHSTLNELPRLLNLATILALLVWIARHFVVIGAPTTEDLLFLLAALAVGLVAGRSIARALAKRVAPVERCLLVGRRNVFARLEEKFRGYPGAQLVGVVRTAEIAGDYTRLAEIAQRENVHRIIVDTDATSAAATVEIVRAVNATGLQVSLLPSLLGTVGGSVVFDDIGGLMLMGVPRFGLSRSSRALKRAFDVVGAGAALVCAAPLLVLVAVAIKLGSRGPVLFRQTRIGRDGAPFRMLKFRSMIDGADALKESLRPHNEADGLFKIHADPRITRAGRLLRRTGIDELPQLLNVIAGHMSLVGPRPLVVDEDSRVTGFDRHRLHLTPGITGRWQILGAARVPLAEMVKIDYLYIANWSPWVDLRIIIDTVVFVAKRRGQ